MDNQPLLPTTVTATTAITSQDINDSNNNSGGILLRFLLIISMGIMSIWANYEASKGFDVAIINDAGDSPAGKRFKLLYTSNDKAVSILQDASAVVQTVLYKNKIPPPPPQHVTLRLLATHELNSTVTVEPTENNELMFTLKISPNLLSMDGRDDGAAFVRAVQRGMARVWILNSRAPSWAVDGMVEHVSMMVGFGVGESLQRNHY